MSLLLFLASFSVSISYSCILIILTRDSLEIKKRNVLWAKSGAITQNNYTKLVVTKAKGFPVTLQSLTSIPLCKNTYFTDKKKEAEKGEITSLKWHKSYLTETEVARSLISTPCLSHGMLSPGEAEFYD